MKLKKMSHGLGLDTGLDRAEARVDLAVGGVAGGLQMEIARMRAAVRVIKRSINVLL